MEKLAQLCRLTTARLTNHDHDLILTNYTQEIVSASKSREVLSLLPQTFVPAKGTCSLCLFYVGGKL